MTQKYIQVSELLIDIEAELRQMNQWQSTRPSAEALASRSPFCIDTLTFSQWLQFIFIPSLMQLIEQNQPLPINCQVTPMAEEYYWGMKLNSILLIEKLSEMDLLLSAQAGES